MGKRFTGAAAYVDSVVVEDGEVRITAAAGATRATTVVTLGRGLDAEELIAVETEAALVLAEMVDSGVEKGSAATVAPADDDGDEGLREGSVVGSAINVGGPMSVAYAKAYAGSRTIEVSGNDEDWIRLPNAEYADLLATARRDAAFREAFTGVLATDDSEVDLEALNAAFAGIPTGPYDVIKHTAGWEVRQLDTDPTNGHHWPVRLCQGIAGQKAGFDDAAANFLAGVLNAWPLVAARLAATEGVEASDVSDAVLDDGGPVEPELDIDALVAAADVQRDACTLDIRAERSAEYPHLTVTVTGPESADLVSRIISDIHLSSLTEPLVVARPVEGDVGEFATTTVDIHVGDNVATLTAERRAAADLRKAFADARLAGGLR